VDDLSGIVEDVKRDDVFVGSACTLQERRSVAHFRKWQAESNRGRKWRHRTTGDHDQSLADQRRIDAGELQSRKAEKNCQHQHVHQ
jgi:hypothetical protein